MRFVVLALLVACGEAKPTGPVAPTSRLQYPLRDAGMNRLISGTRANDAAAIAKLIDGSITYGGLWFEDTTCVRQLSPGTIPAASVSELARCIARLPLHASTRTSMHPEIGVVTYAPGVEVEVLFGGTPDAPKLRWIGYASRLTNIDVLPSVTQDAFESHRIDPAPLVFDVATQAQIDAELVNVNVKFRDVYAWYKVCADVQGNVTRVQARAVSSMVALPHIEAWFRGWKLRPFQLGPQPAPVCSLLRIGAAPADRDLQGMPYPIPVAHVDKVHLLPWMLEKRRTGGEKRIYPDDDDKERIQDSGGNAVAGIFHFCIPTTGTVDKLTMLRSTGFPGYDQKLLAGIRAWTYRPYDREVCTFVTFVYSQR